MIARGSVVQLEELARRSFLLMTRLLLALPRGRRRGSASLKEMEFLTLAVLHEHPSMIVGDIQRILGVLPAQMSRLIRALENRAEPLVTCQINTADKRKINVQLTDAGARSLVDHSAPRVQAIASLFRRLSDDEREALDHLLQRLDDLSGKVPS